MYRFVTIATLSFLSIATSVPASADTTLEIEVREEQAVTLAGESPSLRAVVEKLCERAGIELRGYDAPDRAFNGAYRGIDARTLLARLLREESHVVGLRTSEGKSGTRVAWLRVLGAQGSRGRLPTHAPVPAEAANQPLTPAQTFEQDKEKVLDLLQPAFEADEPDRATAIGAIVKQLTSEPEAREPLLGATQTDIAEQLAEYPDAYAVLTEIEGALLDEQTRENFQHINQQLRVALQKPSAK